MESLKSRIEGLLREAAQRAQKKGLLPPLPLTEVVVERPQRPEFGDYACSLPLKLARAARASPMTLAQALASAMPRAPEVERVEVAPPGFVNLFLSPTWLRGQADAILKAGDGYASVDVGRGQKVQVEFVSVNPTGPIHVGHARGAVLGSVLSNILSAAGFDVQREYYVNDAGSQMEAFYRSLYIRYLQALGHQAEMPAGGYMGSYMVDLGQELAQKEGERYLAMPEGEAIGTLAEWGLERMLASIRDDLASLGTEFDVWFRERSLYDGGQYDQVMRFLEEKGYLAQKEGATWFASTQLGEDKDNVLVRSTGHPTYFASDVAYHYNKFIQRGFDKVIDIWGADHQGHVPRMKAAVEALGIDPHRLSIIIVQMVALKRGEQVLKASKRSGELITLKELVEEVGPDACRYFFISRSPESQMEFDLELAKKESSENPVYYVQYAHARIAGILRHAQEQGLDYSQGNVSLLTHPAEEDLIRKMLLLPELVESGAQALEAHHLPHYALELATAFHWFYENCRVVSDDRPLTAARLKLTAAARVVLARTLSLMGMARPEKM